MRAWSCGLTSAVGTAISLAGTSRVPASRAKAAVGTATPSARTTKCNLKLILTGRLLLLERVSWMNPNLRRIVAIFRVVRNSDQLGPVAKKWNGRRHEVSAWREADVDQTSDSSSLWSRALVPRLLTADRGLGR